MRELRTLTNAMARTVFLHAHALSETPAGPGRGADLAQLLMRLGFVQVDSVSTVARAHDHILWTRRPSYRPAKLRWLNDRARGSFEHWTHDAAVVPMAFYPYWRLRFQRDGDALAARWSRRHGPGFDDSVQQILARIADDGPLSSRQLSGGAKGSSSGWWDWHPAKIAVDFLWRSGQLVVSHRDGFQKHYDLPERVIPAEHLEGYVSDSAIIDWACNAALDRLGFATSGEIAAFWDLVRPGEAKAWVAEALRRGDVEEVDVLCSDGATRRSVMRPDLLASLDQIPSPTSRLRILNPFDPVLRNRHRAERLFGFRYRIEIFVPEAQRCFGYYVFPILEGQRFVGRTEVVVEKDKETLSVRALWPEPSVRWGKGRLQRFEAELHRLADFTGCRGIAFAAGWMRHPKTQP